MKSNIIHNLQHILVKRWGLDVVNKNYNISRLKTMNINQLLDLERETKRDLLIINQIKYKCDK